MAWTGWDTVGPGGERECDTCGHLHFVPRRRGKYLGYYKPCPMGNDPEFGCSCTEYDDYKAALKADRKGK